MKFLDVSHVQAGDDVVINNVHHIVDYVEPNGIAFDMQLHADNGDKVRKSFTPGEIISVDI